MVGHLTPPASAFPRLTCRGATIHHRGSTDDRTAPRTRRRPGAAHGRDRARPGQGTGGLVLLRGATGTGRTAVLGSRRSGTPRTSACGCCGPAAHPRTPASPSPPSSTSSVRYRVHGPGTGRRRPRQRGPAVAAAALVRGRGSAAGRRGRRAPGRRRLAALAGRGGPARRPITGTAGGHRAQSVRHRTAPAGLTQALSPSLVRTHTVAPLSDAAAAGLVRAAFPAAGPRWTRECVRAGAGSPLLLHALLDDLGGIPRQDGPAPDGAPPLPDTCAALCPGTYPAAVSWWLNSAGPATADVGPLPRGTGTGVATGHGRRPGPRPGGTRRTDAGRPGMPSHPRHGAEPLRRRTPTTREARAPPAGAARPAHGAHGAHAVRAGRRGDPARPGRAARALPTRTPRTRRPRGPTRTRSTTPTRSTPPYTQPAPYAQRTESTPYALARPYPQYGRLSEPPTHRTGRCRGRPTIPPGDVRPRRGPGTRSICSPRRPVPIPPGSPVGSPR